MTDDRSEHSHYSAHINHSSDWPVFKSNDCRRRMPTKNQHALTNHNRQARYDYIHTIYCCIYMNNIINPENPNPSTIHYSDVR